MHRFQVLALFIAFCTFPFSISGCTVDVSRPCTFLIPQGYIGWIRVKYAVKGAKPLPIENGAYLVRIPAQGLLKTSTVEGEGWKVVRYYYINKSGKRTRLPDPSSGDNSYVWGGAGRTNEGWEFVGSKKNFNDAEALYPSYDPGPLKLPQ